MLLAHLDLYDVLANFWSILYTCNYVNVTYIFLFLTCKILLPVNLVIKHLT